MESDLYCPICLEEYLYKNNIIKISCKNYGIKSDCVHYFCKKCIEIMYGKNMYECPLCRTDITELIYYTIRLNNEYLQKFVNNDVKNEYLDNNDITYINSIYDNFETIFQLNITDFLNNNQEKEELNDQNSEDLSYEKSDEDKESNEEINYFVDDNTDSE
jgi:hypothetical protein